MELLSIETFNDGNNIVKTVFRKLYTKFPLPSSGEKPEIIVAFQDYHAGTAGVFDKPFTIITSNEIDQVPVFTVQPDGLEPVMIEPTPELLPEDPNYKEPYQKTIGGFDVWRTLIFENAFMPLNVAFTDVVKRQKGLTSTPMFYVE